MLKYRRMNIWLYIMLGALALGVLVGGIYAGGLSAETGEELKVYLNEYFQSTTRTKKEIFFSSLYDNLRVFAVIFAAGFFKAGAVASIGVNLAEGFVSGFTGAALIKLLGMRGFLVNASSILSAVIFVGVLVFFGGYSAGFGVSGRKREYGGKKEYFIFSALALTIFCIASFFDGYITTTFMDFIVKKL